MTIFCTHDDVENRLRRTLDETELEYLPWLIEEAQVLVVAHLGCGPDRYPTDKDVPAAVRVTTSRMVARVLQQAESMPVESFGASQIGVTAGPYSQQTSYAGETRLGSPWLAKSDRESLAPYQCGGKAFTVDTAPSGGSIHAIWCSANKFADPALAYWTAYCDCGADIAGRPIYGGDQ